MGYRRNNRSSSSNAAAPRRRRYCGFCVDKVKIDYKETDTLSRYINDFGRIKPRRQTGTCARHQRRLAIAIKRARHIALLPFVRE